MWFYYRQVGDAEPSEPAQASDIVDEVAKGFSMQQNRKRITTEEKEKGVCKESSDAVEKLGRSTQKSSATPSHVTPHKSNARDEEEKDEEDSSSSGDEPSVNYQNIWWDYKRNAKIFGCDPLKVDCKGILLSPSRQQISSDLW